MSFHGSASENESFVCSSEGCRSAQSARAFESAVWEGIDPTLAW